MDQSLKKESHEADFNIVSNKFPLNVLADVQNVLEEKLVPLVERVDTLEDIRSFIDSKPGYLAITVPAQKLFSVEHFA